MQGTMDRPKTTLERAFEQARSGQFDTVTQLRRSLSNDGYDRFQVDGRALIRQLSKLIVAARKQPGA
jgi:hypothetical protein